MPCTRLTLSVWVGASVTRHGGILSQERDSTFLSRRDSSRPGVTHTVLIVAISVRLNPVYSFSGRNYEPLHTSLYVHTPPALPDWSTDKAGFNPIIFARGAPCCNAWPCLIVFINGMRPQYSLPKRVRHPRLFLRFKPQISLWSCASYILYEWDIFCTYIRAPLIPGMIPNCRGFVAGKRFTER